MLIFLKVITKLVSLYKCRNSKMAQFCSFLLFAAHFFTYEWFILLYLPFKS